MTILTSASQRDLLKWLSSYDQLCLSSSILLSFTWSNALGIFSKPLSSLPVLPLVAIRRQTWPQAGLRRGNILSWSHTVSCSKRHNQKLQNIHFRQNGYIERNSASHPQIPTKHEMMLDDFKESVEDEEEPAKCIAKFSETR